MTEIPLLTLDTVARYLREKEVQMDLEENGGQRFIRMGWRFEMGDAAVLVSVNDGPNNTSRLEITCVTQKTYVERRQQAMAMLNDRNRERAFSRSIDSEGNVWLEYVGLYPTLIELPQETFDTIFGGILTHFQEDYALMEQLTPSLQA